MDENTKTSCLSGARSRATIFGFISILIWSTMFGVSADLNSTVGALWAGALSYLGGGAIGLAIILMQGRLGALLLLPWKYLFGCGLLFSLYSTTMFISIQISSGPEQAIEVSLVNYLWPTMILVLSVPLLRTKMRWFLPVGIFAATGGIALVLGFNFSSDSDFICHISDGAWPYGLMFMGAICWALHSLLIRRWSPKDASSVDGLMSLFLLGSGVILLFLAILMPQKIWNTEMSPRIIAEIAFLSLFPSWAAYTLWNKAMRVGDVILVTSASYLTPLLSTVFCCVFLGVPFSGKLLTGCVLLIVGAVICRFSLIEHKN